MVYQGDWYKMYAEQLAPKLQTRYSHCLEHDSLRPTMYQAYIILMPKPGKDPKSCASYRPISLLNYDLKILTKVVAARLVKVLLSLVNIDQTGLMPPGKSTDINLR